MLKGRLYSIILSSIIMLSVAGNCGQIQAPPTAQSDSTTDYSIELTTTLAPPQPVETPFYLYDQTTLQYWQTRYPTSTRKIYDLGMLPSLLPHEKESLAEVAFQFPLVGDNGFHNNPLAFYSTSDPPTVIMPIQSLKFLDDLSTAYAWLWANGYSLETVTDYMAMLKYQKEDLLKGRHPTPLVALQIPDNALEDPAVDDLSLRFFNTARAFILAHELGHIYQEHPGNKRVTFRESQINEEEADLFALDLMGRTSTIPMGAYLFFLVQAHWEPNKGDFQSDVEWQTHLASSTHPFTAHRMDAIAEELVGSTEDYIQNEPDPTTALETVNFIADNMSYIVDLLEDPEVQLSIAFKGRATDQSFLAPRRPGTLPCHYSQVFSEQDTSSPFQGIYQGEYVLHLKEASPEVLPMCLILKRNNERVNGFFSFGLGEGVVFGQVVGNRLIFNWQWGEYSGKGVFESVQQGQGFSGVWGYNESHEGGGEWRGFKQ